MPQSLMPLLMASLFLSLVSHAARSAEADCHPVCSFQCDDPVCPALCSFSCPETLCLAAPCEDSECTCESFGELQVGECRLLAHASCPECDVGRTGRNCQNQAGRSCTCRTSCTAQPCTLSCQSPPFCPEPKCELQCESPACEFSDDENSSSLL